MATVKFDNASRTYPGNDTPSVDRLNIDIEDGEFLVLVGPSGCGKSTSLRMLAGLEEVNEGDIWIGDRNVTDLSPKDRDVAMVFQNYALYPHMSVADNMGFALKIAGINKSEIAKRVQDDAKIRVQTRTQIASLQRRLGVTMVYVTHDQIEAMTMGDRVAVLKDGILQQCDTPRGMYDHPENVFVAGFIGSPAMNLFDVPVVDGGVLFGTATYPIERDFLTDEGKEVTLGVRPEDLSINETGEGLPVTVDVVEELGADAYIYGSTTETAGDIKPIIVRVDGRTPPKKGAVVHLSPKKGEHVHLFSPESGLRLGG